jgi:transcriptional regulator with XRE-family HTH domain
MQDFRSGSTIGNRLIVARKARGLLRSQLALRSGIEPRLLRVWERDEEMLPPSYAGRISSELGVTADWLINGDSISPASVEAQQRALPGARTSLKGLKGRASRLHRWFQERERADLHLQCQKAESPGARLRAARLAARLYQNDVLFAVGLPKGRLTALEGDHDAPSPEELSRLASFFGLPPDSLAP